MKTKLFKASLFVLGGFFLLLTSCNESKKESLDLIQIRGEAQGTTYSILYYTNSDEELKTAIDSVLDKIDNSLSNWVSSSLISELNRAELSKFSLRDTFGFLSDMLSASERFYEQSEGAFDPSVLPLVNAWGFGLSKRAEVDSSQIDSLMNFVGMNRLQFEMKASHLTIEKPIETKLDFNAIAQGYSADVLAEFLESKNIRSYMIELGGEMRLGDPKPMAELWKVGIDKPMNPEEGREMQKVLELANKSIATSGSYRKFYELNGQRYSHTINPLLGYPVQHNLLSASVIANSAADADALATICMVLGLEKSKEYIAKLDQEVEVYLIYQAENGELKSYQN